ncbi:MAG: hypothetical protein D8M51_11515 [Ignavibacteriae bacterium]|nr:hypothetical protein [Ignavibacteriota bacterium]
MGEKEFVNTNSTHRPAFACRQAELNKNRFLCLTCHFCLIKKGSCLHFPFTIFSKRSFILVESFFLL